MDQITFHPLKIKRLSEMIEGSIKDFIITGALKPGHKLPNEKQIANQFGVSAVTVREALRGLEAYGIIHKKRGRDGGIFVGADNTSGEMNPNTAQNLLVSGKYGAKDIGEVRKILEPAIVRIATLNITEKELQSLKKNIKYCEDRVKKIKTDSPDKANINIKERHLEFHRLIAEATHNPVLSLILDQTEDFELALNKTQVYSKEHNLDVIQHHKDIFEQLVKRDPDAAEKLMLNHTDFVDKCDRGSELLEPEIPGKKKRTNKQSDNK
jgi:GntR family transcriptional regulator, transcriptional repressor for pyruvate dehydrogenase complex